VEGRWGCPIQLCFQDCPGFLDAQYTTHWTLPRTPHRERSEPRLHATGQPAARHFPVRLSTVAQKELHFVGRGRSGSGQAFLYAFDLLRRPAPTPIANPPHDPQAGPGIRLSENLDGDREQRKTSGCGPQTGNGGCARLGPLRRVSSPAGANKSVRDGAVMASARRYFVGF